MITKHKHCWNYFSEKCSRFVLERLKLVLKELVFEVDGLVVGRAQANWTFIAFSISQRSNDSMIRFRLH